MDTNKRTSTGTHAQCRFADLDSTRHYVLLFRRNETVKKCTQRLWTEIRALTVQKQMRSPRSSWQSPEFQRHGFANLHSKQTKEQEIVDASTLAHCIGMDTLNGTYISIKRPSTYRATSTAPRIQTQISAPTVQEQMRSVDSKTCTVHKQKSKMSLTPVHVHTAFLGDTEWHLHYNENHQVPTERHPQHYFADKLFVVSEQMNILYRTVGSIYGHVGSIYGHEHVRSLARS